MRPPLLSGCVLRVLPDQHGKGGRGEDIVHHTGGNELLRPHALWAQERRSDFLADHANHLTGLAVPQCRGLRR